MPKEVSKRKSNETVVENTKQKTTIQSDERKGEKRKVNEEKLLHKSLAKKIASIVSDVALVFLILASSIVCFSTIYSRINQTLPSFGGFSFMQIVTGSMTNETIEINGETYESGNKKGDKIVIQSVDTDTLNVGDRIAFYVSAESFNDFYKSTTKQKVEETHEIEYKTTAKGFFGVQTKEITEASKAKSKLVFHHIVAVYEDGDTRWFLTQGSSNPTRDYWVIKDSYVVGTYSDSAVGKVVAGVLQFLSSPTGLILAVVSPLLLMIGFALIQCWKALSLVKLELDCVEGKRKITDEVCVKNNIGYGMSKRDKLRVLEHALPNERKEYISLLWKAGSEPKEVKSV